MINGAHLRPHLQVEELHVTEGKKILDVQVSGKLGQEDEHIHRGEVVKVPMRMAIAHKGGGTGRMSTAELLTRGRTPGGTAGRRCRRRRRRPSWHWLSPVQLSSHLSASEAVCDGVLARRY
ncbi:hypothetical protein E2562_009158 [Oryza meyeriana var. granulata]|uniref:Uncharacterized protein n=1 Tax=Oryza meyeriana var. granulata TaxID=110450 RepID=A0A6G1CFW3_9ORYZ|nr:hypothetical protein E2562_009158 [Oryza meyeriana var. granulata]